MKAITPINAETVAIFGKEPGPQCDLVLQGYFQAYSRMVVHEDVDRI